MSKIAQNGVTLHKKEEKISNESFNKVESCVPFRVKLLCLEYGGIQIGSFSKSANSYLGSRRLQD
jgi:hypothetical protein